MDDAPETPETPVSSPYGPPAVEAVSYPPPFADERINPQKSGFGVTSVCIGALAVIIAVTLTTATFATIALINVRRLGKPWVAAVTGISLAGIALLATVWNYFLG